MGCIAYTDTGEICANHGMNQMRGKVARYCLMLPGRALVDTNVRLSEEGYSCQTDTTKKLATGAMFGNTLYFVASPTHCSEDAPINSRSFMQIAIAVSVVSP